jgi:hypothetical protein
LATQEGLVDFYLDELNLLAEQHEIMKGLADKSKEAKGSAYEFAGALAGLDFEKGIDQFEELMGNWDEIISGLDVVMAGFEDGRRVIEAFFAGLRGEFLTDNPELLENLSPEVVTAIKLGRDIKGVWDTLSGKLQDIQKWFSKIRQDISEFDLSKVEGVSRFMGNVKKYAPYILVAVGGLAALALTFVVLGKLATVILGIDAFFKSLALASVAFSTGLATIGTALGSIFTVIGPVILALIAIGAVVIGVIENFEWFQTAFAAIWESLQNSIAQIGLTTALGELRDALAELWVLVKPILGFIGVALIAIGVIVAKTATFIIAGVIPPLITALTGIINFITGIISGVSGGIKLIVALVTGNRKAFAEAWLQMFGSLGKLVQGVMQFVGGLLSAGLNILLATVYGIVTSIAELLGFPIKYTTEEIVKDFANMALGMRDWINRAKTWVLTAVLDVIETLSKISEFVPALKIDFAGVSSSIQTALGSIGIDAQKLEQNTSGPFSNFIKNLTGIGTGAETTAADFGFNMDTLAGGVTDLETETKNPLNNFLGQLLGIDTTASTAADLFEGNMDTIVGGVQGLEKDAAKPLQEMIASLLGLGETSDEAVSTSQTAFDQYNNAINGISNDVSTNIGGFGLDVQTTLGNVETSFGDMESTANDKLYDVETYLGNFSNTANVTDLDVGDSTDNMETSIIDMHNLFDDKLDAIYGTDGMLATLSSKFDEIVTDIAGDGGYLEIFMNKVAEMGAYLYGEGGEFEGILGKIKLSFHDLGSYVGGVIGTLRIDIDNLLGAFEELERKTVKNSYVPDMAKGVVKWMNWMVDNSFPAVTGMTSEISQQMSAMSAATGIDQAFATGGGIAEGGFQGNGPLVQINSLVVPNQNVARTFAAEISDQLARKAGWRRTSS